MQKKLIAILMLLTFTLCVPGAVNAADKVVTENEVVVFKLGDYNYYVQKTGSDELVKTPMDVAPQVKFQRTFVPVRFLGNALGITDDNIMWEQPIQTATLKGNAELKLKIGEKAIVSDGVRKEIDVASYAVPPGRTMLPARYVAEGLGYEVGWDQQNQIVYCWEKGKAEPDPQKIAEQVKKLQPIMPTPPPKDPNLRTLSNPEIKQIAMWFADKGYEVEVPKLVGYNNDYGTIWINISRKDPRKAQFDKDVAMQVEKFANKEVADEIVDMLKVCEHPNCHAMSESKGYNKKWVTVFFNHSYEPDLVTVEFDYSYFE